MWKRHRHATAVVWLENYPEESYYHHQITEDGSWTVSHAQSQYHRMVGVGRDLCGSSSPTLLPKQGHLQQAAQDLVQAGL